MLEKDYVKKEMMALTDIREDFYTYLDANITKDEDGKYDFSNAPMLSAQDVYEKFFALDYQARKLRGFLVEAYAF